MHARSMDRGYRGDCGRSCGGIADNMSTDQLDAKVRQKDRDGNHEGLRSQALIIIDSEASLQQCTWTYSNYWVKSSRSTPLFNQR